MFQVAVPSSAHVVFSTGLVLGSLSPVNYCCHKKGRPSLTIIMLECITRPSSLQLPLIAHQLTKLISLNVFLAQENEVCAEYSPVFDVLEGTREIQ